MYEQGTSEAGMARLLRKVQSLRCTLCSTSFVYNVSLREFTIIFICQIDLAGNSAGRWTSACKQGGRQEGSLSRGRASQLLT
jgi:hypothetical protein